MGKMNQIVNGERDGYWEWYHSNGRLCYKGHFILTFDYD
jgi:hypothetical protein